ncbi:MAG: transposase [Proteobacteria bacterium]|nr:transposase [Pseudomonadota bacterium]
MEKQLVRRQLPVINVPVQPKIMGKALGIVYRTIATHLTHKAGYKNSTAHTGAVTLIQRFGSALNLNIHFHMLFLVTAHRHPGRLEHQNIGGHQDRIAVQRHRDAFVRILVAALNIRLHGSLVRMRTIHQALGRHARQNPCQLWNFRNIGLPVEHRVIHVHPKRQPRCCYFQR